MDLEGDDRQLDDQEPHDENAQMPGPGQQIENGDMEMGNQQPVVQELQVENVQIPVPGQQIGNEDLDIGNPQPADGNDQLPAMGQQNEDVVLIFQNNIHLGMVRTFFFSEPEIPLPSDHSKLAPKTDSFKKGKSSTVVEIPDQWLSFFHALLLASAQHS